MFPHVTVKACGPLVRDHMQVNWYAVGTSVDLYPKFVTPWFAGFISIEVTSLSIVGGLYGKCKKKKKVQDDF